ncbi:MAG: hypothetical protein PWQ06_2083 [Anaerophaga sp.]|nr:hypothetical protein [Anaerophaga sp.]
MTEELDSTSENQDVERTDKVSSKSLMLFKTDIDRYGRDITAMYNDPIG